MQSSLLHNTHTFRATQALVVPAPCEEEQLLQSPDTARTLQTTKVRWRSASFLQQGLCFPEWWTPSFRGLTGWLSSEVEEQSRGALGSSLWSSEQSSPCNVYAATSNHFTNDFLPKQVQTYTRRCQQTLFPSPTSFNLLSASDNGKSRKGKLFCPRHFLIW